MGKVERRVITWMPLRTMEDWGFEWPGEGQGVVPGAARLVTRLGLSTILDFLGGGDEIPKNIAIGLEGYGDSRPDFPKGCTYQERWHDELFCKAATKDDPWAGLTNGPLCATCPMPDKMLACSELAHVKTRWFQAHLEGGIRRVIEARCIGANDPGTGVDCIPGVKDCWLRRISVP